MDAALRPYLYLLLKLIYDLPIQHDDPKITALNDFKTVNLDYRFGLTDPERSFATGAFSQTASFVVQVEKWEYEIGVDYLLARLQHIPFDGSNIRDAAQVLLDSYIPGALYNEYASNDLVRAMRYKPGESFPVYCDCFASYIDGCFRRIESSGPFDALSEEIP